MAEHASGEESKSDSDATDGELHRTCRICYSAEFQDGMGAFLRPTHSMRPTDPSTAVTVSHKHIQGCAKSTRS